MPQIHHVHKSVLEGNRQTARQNRSLLTEHNILTLNLISSPGAGKTTILERTIDYLSDKNITIGVIEGDITTTLDAERIASHNVKTVQINTHGACHLDASMIQNVLPSFQLNEIDILIIENVGNLVCPIDFDLGEQFRIAAVSTTEGEDKVVKYPSVFRQADAVLLNKMDLLPYIPFELNKFLLDMNELNPKAPVFKMSALKGDGLEKWGDWLIDRVKQQSNEKG